MKLDKLVTEELTRMRSLFSYERGKVVSEQEIQEIGFGAAAVAAAQAARTTPSGYNLSQTTTPAATTPATPPPIPSELKDLEGVKKFQDWLDTNKKGWASGYVNGVLNKVGKGYGRMGPRTTKAWNLYKAEFLSPAGEVKPITSQDIKTINSDVAATNTPAAAQPTEQPATGKGPQPTEPGQPGEYRDGWSFDEKSQTWV